jgi:hypothetical protein
MQASVLKASHGTPEAHRLFDFPLSIEFAFAALQVHVICHHNCEGFPMENWRVPVFPTPVEDPRVLNEMIDAVL